LLKETVLKKEEDLKHLSCKSMIIINELIKKGLWLKGQQAEVI